MAKATILLVQNAKTSGNGTKRYLEGTGFDVVWTGSGVAALAAAKQRSVDLILLDAALPDIEATELCQLFRLRERTSAVPILLLTAPGFMPNRSNGKHRLPDECLAKPYTSSDLNAKLAALLGTKMPEKAPEEASPLMEQAAPQPALGPAPAAEPRAEQEPQPAPQPEATPSAPRAAGEPPAAPAESEVIDAATGLFGRSQFEAMFSKEFKRSVRFKQQMSCMLIDLDGRKIGREADEATLKAIVGLVQQTIREVDTAAWWSGEALIVLLPNTIRNDAVQAAARILEAVAMHPFTWPDSAKVTMSIGVAGLPDRKLNTEQKLIDAAAAACRRARGFLQP